MQNLKKYSNSIYLFFDYFYTIKLTELWLKILKPIFSMNQKLQLKQLKILTINFGVMPVYLHKSLSSGKNINTVS